MQDRGTLCADRHCCALHTTSFLWWSQTGLVIVGSAQSWYTFAFVYQLCIESAFWMGLAVTRQACTTSAGTVTHGKRRTLCKDSPAPALHGAAADTHIHTYKHACVHACMRASIHACACACANAYMHMHMHVRVHNKQNHIHPLSLSLSLSRTPRNTSEKQLHFWWTSMFCSIFQKIQLLVSFDGRRKRIRF